MLRFGLCCVFVEAPIKFRRTTARHALSIPRAERHRMLSQIALHNARALEQALRYCHEKGIGAFRINSQVLPLKTHPQAGYQLRELPEGAAVERLFRRCGRLSRRLNLRTTFHPDQFVVLNSPDPLVVRKAVAELSYQARVAGWVNADVITLHAGGGYNDKASALNRLVETIQTLPPPVRRRLALENDDRVFAPRDLLPICRRTGVPLVYDIHHHRCLPDGMSVEEATLQALATWRREPLFHLSSPHFAWGTGPCGPHNDFIRKEDFPKHWLNLSLTIEVEAKAKEKAVLKLMKDFKPPDS